MKKEDKEYLQERVENEGFDYCFVHYSDFEEIKDKKFHELREAYCKAQEALAEYLDIDQ